MNETILTTDPAAPMRLRAAMAETTDPQSLRVWDAFLDRVYAKALETGDVTPLHEFLAHTWLSIDAYRQTVRDDAPPPAWLRVSALEFAIAWEAAHPGHILKV